MRYSCGRLAWWSWLEEVSSEDETFTVDMLWLLEFVAKHCLSFEAKRSLLWLLLTSSEDVEHVRSMRLLLISLTLESPPPETGNQPPVDSSRVITWALTRAMVHVLFVTLIIVSRFVDDDVVVELLRSDDGPGLCWVVGREGVLKPGWLWCVCCWRRLLRDSIGEPSDDDVSVMITPEDDLREEVVEAEEVLRTIELVVEGDSEACRYEDLVMEDKVSWWWLSLFLLLLAGKPLIDIPSTWRGQLSGDEASKDLTSLKAWGVAVVLLRSQEDVEGKEVWWWAMTMMEGEPLVISEARM